MNPVQIEAESLVDTKWIASHLTDPNVRLIESDVAAKAYNSGHIPGAVLWNAYTDLRDPSYVPIDRSGLEQLLSRSGITPQTTVVVYGYSGPLGFWLLKANGHQDVRLLAGSRDQWAKSGHEWSVDVPEVQETLYSFGPADTELIASRQDVESAIGNQSQMVLDVRAEAEFTGEQFWPSGATEDVGRAGHVPGATNIPIALLRQEDETLKSADELREVFQRAGVTPDKELITYCTIGNRAAQAWFGLKYILGYPNVRVYYGSWVEWGKLPDTAIESNQGKTADSNANPGPGSVGANTPRGLR
jgi:thiosulfate/3-mercaptopyruvate sulfurtransferase